MSSLWEAAKRNPFLITAQCEPKMGAEQKLVANRTIGAAAAGNLHGSGISHQLQVPHGLAVTVWSPIS